MKKAGKYVPLYKYRTFIITTILLHCRYFIKNVIQCDTNIRLAAYS